FQAEDGIRDFHVTGVQTCALPISQGLRGGASGQAGGVLRAQGLRGVPPPWHRDLGQPPADAAEEERPGEDGRRHPPDPGQGPPPRPGTSPEAAASVAHRPQARQASLQIVPERPRTDEEVYAGVVARGLRISVSGTRTRRRELVDAGLVEDSGQVKLTGAGRRTIVWRAT